MHVDKIYQLQMEPITGDFTQSMVNYINTRGGVVPPTNYAVNYSATLYDINDNTKPVGRLDGSYETTVLNNIPKTINNFKVEIDNVGIIFSGTLLNIFNGTLKPGFKSIQRWTSPILNNETVNLLFELKGYCVLDIITENLFVLTISVEDHD